MKLKRFFAALVALVGVGVCGEGVGQSSVSDYVVDPRDWRGIDAAFRAAEPEPTTFYQDLTNAQYYYTPDALVNPSAPNGLFVYDDNLITRGDVPYATFQARANALRDFTLAAQDGWNYSPLAARMFSDGDFRGAAFQASARYTTTGFPAKRWGTGANLMEGLRNTPFGCPENANHILRTFLPVLERAGSAANMTWNLVPHGDGHKLTFYQRFPTIYQSHGTGPNNFFKLAHGHQLALQMPVDHYDRSRIASKLALANPQSNASLVMRRDRYGKLVIEQEPVLPKMQSVWGSHGRPPRPNEVTVGHKAVKGAAFGLAGDVASIVAARDAAAAEAGCPTAKARLETVSTVAESVDFWLYESIRNTPGVGWFSWGRKGIHATWDAYHTRFGEKAPSQRLWDNLQQALGGLCGDEAGRRQYELDFQPGPMGT